MNFFRSLIERVAQNHAVEHATIHLLAQHYPSLRLAGRTTASGFLLYGQVATEVIVETVMEALERLRNGEHELAVHPNCGTNVVVGGVLAGLAAWLATGGRRRSFWEQMPLALLAATAALLIAQPLGLLVQERVTTSPAVGDLCLRQVVSGQWGRAMAHRVELGRR
ncbi:MAG: DUF6391 domain-containing protein [Anaerolineae bacterium]|nr:DUF6391 domain-containing protein [Anaerolineae bacterium]